MALPGRRETVTFRDAAIIYKNFAGEAKKYNAEGLRNFSIMIGEKQAADLEANGWNVRPMRRQEEDVEQLFHLKVKVNFANRPPRVWLISSAGRTMLGEGLVGMMDQLEFTKIDAVVVAYDWKLDTGATGRTAYLESMFATMYESELELEYADVPQIAVAGGDAPRELESGARKAFDYEGEIVDEER